MAGIAQIFRESCPDAVYDSQGRYPPPRCLPRTRQAVLEEIFDWIGGERENILWLYGPAGVGKSAIAQTVAEICAKKGILVASFFFSRDSPGRDTTGRLIPSIVYQLAVSMPEKRSLIGKTVEGDLSILHKSAKAQVEALIIPLFLSDSRNNSMAPEKVHCQPFVIIIDGLDECRGDNNQREVIHIIEELVHNSHVPFRFFIASRPEPQIKNAFRLFTGSLCNVSLSDSDHMAQGKQDVLTFLKEGFANIMEKRHEEMSYIQEPWPGNSIITQLTSKAGGMFIYASTVLKYIDDDDFHPPDRLKEIINTPTGRTPFAELDRLYKHILSESNEQELLLRILGVLLLQTTRKRGFLGVFEIEILLQLLPGTIRRVLRRMHSILDIVEFGKIHFFHASFGDFILNRTRAERYYIDKANVHAFMAEALVRLLGTRSG
ncbi:hypothetical protein BDZ94DRAFT_1221180 [Collybia nuda]|uniref:Nephrocystin 3-like N-terminal domain-containing protein n=1 Tax=Collybia nuda TaxID=64659 RepID=A0A9P5Y5G5_9AGAR|nr:hypothetical protein BDZ94DRAFT_1221180 [Collybia nuda]